MQIYWTVSQLMHLTRNELCELAEDIRKLLVDFEAGSVERTSALITLDNIRRVIALRNFPIPRR